MQRASANDLTTLATDRGPVPMNIGVVLILEDAASVDPAAFSALLAERVTRAPRLRQRLERVPFGCGRPIWVDDEGFDLAHHLAHLEGEHDVLQVAADVVCQRLDPDRPLWRARLLTGLPADRAALVIVMHHVVADGLGGLALLGSLIDGGPGAGSVAFPAPRPARRELVADATRDRWTRMKGLPSRLRQTGQGLRELGLGSAPKLAERTSLNRPTGSRRRLTTVDLDLADIVAAGHALGVTVNDIVLTAVSGGLIEILSRRGEYPETLVISVPITAHRGTDLGNQVGVVPVQVPTSRDPRVRLRSVSAQIRSRSAHNRGSSAGPVGLLFRTLGRLGVVQVFLDHQRLVHTFETNMRGPNQRLKLGRMPVTSLVPIAVNPGNVGVSFDVLSYAGRLVVTVVADPVILPEQDALTARLREEFAALTGGAR